MIKVTGKVKCVTCCVSYLYGKLNVAHIRRLLTFLGLTHFPNCLLVSGGSVHVYCINIVSGGNTHSNISAILRVVSVTSAETSEYQTVSCCII